jgi:hypothetical protein
MKIKTDTNGNTTCELSTQDRKTLAAAKTILVRVAVATHGTNQGAAATSVANAIRHYLKVDGIPDEEATPEAAPESKGEADA